jgi:hypothetical protein
VVAYGSHLPALFGWLAEPQGELATETQSQKGKRQRKSSCLKQPEVFYAIKLTNDQRPTTNDQRPTTNDQRPTTDDRWLPAVDCLSMPELPEVETIARGLHKRVAGDTIESIWLGSKPQTMKSRPAEIAAALEHTRIAQVRRIGKHIVFDLERTGVGQTPSPANSNLNQTLSSNNSSSRKTSKSRGRSAQRKKRPLSLGPTSA